MLMVRILPWTRLICNIRLFCVPRIWTGSVQMKASKTFIRGNMCIEREREKNNFKSREVKRLKECTLALIKDWSTLSLIMDFSFLLSNWLKMYKMRCTRQINIHYFPFCLILSKLQYWHFGNMFYGKVPQY